MGFFPEYHGIPQFQNFHQNLGGIPFTSAPQQTIQIAHHPQLLRNPNFMGNYPPFRAQQPISAYVQNLPQVPVGPQINNELVQNQG